MAVVLLKERDEGEELEGEGEEAEQSRDGGTHRGDQEHREREVFGVEGVRYVNGVCDVEGVELRIAARHLEVRAVGRLGNYYKGPYLQHNFLVRCADLLWRENGRVGKRERLWHILPCGGLYSRPGDVFAFITWLLVLLFPFIIIPVACYCGNDVNIPNCIVCTVLLMGHVTAAYLVSKNYKKFKRLWFASSADIQKYMGLQNYVTEVTSRNVSNLEFVSAGKRMDIIRHLALSPDNRAWVMLCTRAFWRSRVTDPLICLFIIAAITLVALIVQLYIISTHPVQA